MNVTYDKRVYIGVDPEIVEKLKYYRQEAAKWDLKYISEPLETYKRFASNYWLLANDMINEIKKCKSFKIDKKL